MSAKTALRYEDYMHGSPIGQMKYVQNSFRQQVYVFFIENNLFF